jgi:regulatory protein
VKITDIKAQVKREGRYSIFVDGKYSFSLSENELLNAGIKIGQEYDEAWLEQLKKTAVEDKAMMRAYDLLARRPRSVHEMREYLKRKDYEPELIEKILNALSDRGYLDDEKFARAWVENRRLLKNTSKRRLMLELQQKRISSEIISLVLEEDETDEHQVLKEVIAKKSTQSRYQDEQKLIAYLLRQGFNYSDIKTVLQEESS